MEQYILIVQHLSYWQRESLNRNFLLDLMALDADNYVFTYSFIWTDQEVSFVDLRTKKAISANYEGTISENTMAHNCFYHIENNFILFLSDLIIISIK